MPPPLVGNQLQCHQENITSFNKKIKAVYLCAWVDSEHDKRDINNGLCDPAQAEVLLTYAAVIVIIIITERACFR